MKKSQTTLRLGRPGGGEGSVVYLVDAAGPGDGDIEAESDDSAMWTDRK